MEEQKILFADLYAMIEGIKEETKILNKCLPKILEDKSWAEMTMIVNGMHSEAAAIYTICEYIAKCVNTFVENGPYAWQKGNRLPLEGLSEE